MSSKARNIAIGTFIAGTVGYIAGLLTAPQTGAKTRTSLRAAREISTLEIEKQLKRLHTELNQLIGETDKADRKDATHTHYENIEVLEGEVIGKATRARQKTREILSALHDGNADDNDLDTAVAEATKAIKSIKSYLRKK